METNETKIGPVLVVSLQGHLDTLSSQGLEDRLTALIAGGEHRLLLDCSSLEYVNSSGLKAILVTAKALEPVGGKLVLCGLSPNVFMIFEMIGFTRILTIVSTREEALGAFEAAAAPAV